MTYLILGLVVFLGVHSVRIVADGWRTRARRRLGAGTWKAAYSLLSLLGLALLIWGFGQAREQPHVLWLPPVGMRYVAGLLNLVAFVLLAAAYVPGNGIKARIHHPMTVGVMVWALAHLASTGMLAHLVLFGAFLLWAVLCFIAARRRDQAATVVYPAGRASASVLTVALGVAAWASVAFWLHGMLVEVRPFN